MMANGSDDDRTKSSAALTAGVVVWHYEIISKIGAGVLGKAGNVSYRGVRRVHLANGCISTLDGCGAGVQDYDGGDTANYAGQFNGRVVIMHGGLIISESINSIRRLLY